jgi:hypothetical protein
MRLAPSLTLAVVSCLAFACGDDPPSDSGSGGVDTGISGPTTTGSDDGSASQDETGPLLDVGGGSGEGADEGGAMGCTKVDVVISVDNSSSMTEEIAALQGPVFDSFPQTLLDIHNGLDDFQLGLIDACPKPAALHDSGDNGPCGYTTGANYMVSSSPALADEFACATELPFMAGWSGGEDTCDDGLDDDEQPAYTAASVVSPPFVGDANAGFVRPDALLMVVAITDEDEAMVDPADALEVYDMLVAAKGGDVNRVAYMGVAGGSNCDGAYGSANDATVAQAIAQLFETQGRGMFWDLCQGQLEIGFETFIQTVVDSACMDFVPQG